MFLAGLNFIGLTFAPAVLGELPAELLALGVVEGTFCHTASPLAWALDYAITFYHLGIVLVTAFFAFQIRTIASNGAAGKSDSPVQKMLNESLQMFFAIYNVIFVSCLVLAASQTDSRSSCPSGANSASRFLRLALLTPWG